MPRYDLDCQSCGTSEDLLPASQTEFTCPKCGGPATKRGAYRTKNVMTGVGYQGSDRQNAHFNSDRVQAQLKAGTLRIPHKGEDVFHDGPEDDPYRQAQAELAEAAEAEQLIENDFQLAEAAGGEYQEWRAEKGLPPDVPASVEKV